MLTQRAAGKREQDLGLEGGCVQWQDEPDLALVAVWHRHGLNRNRSLTLIAGTGLLSGAMASTYAHDPHNLVVHRAQRQPTWLRRPDA